MKKRGIDVLLLGWCLLSVVIGTAMGRYAFPVEKVVEKTVENCTVQHSNGNTRLISNMQYTVEHLEAQVNGIEYWLYMTSNTPSLYINGNWVKQLNVQIDRALLDLEQIKQWVKDDPSKLETASQAQEKFYTAVSSLRNGMEQGNQEEIYYSVRVLGELRNFLMLKMEWE